MATYDVYLIRTVSQSIKVEADSPAAAAQQALDEHELEPNVSNRFEPDGEVEVFSVKQGETVVWDSETDPASKIGL